LAGFFFYLSFTYRIVSWLSALQPKILIRHQVLAQDVLMHQCAKDSLPEFGGRLRQIADAMGRIDQCDNLRHMDLRQLNSYSSLQFHVVPELSWQQLQI
jgi:hypothetical protein